MSVFAAKDTVSGLVERYPSLDVCQQSILEACKVLTNGLRSGSKLLLCGNGGSAADCEHIVGELMKGFRSARTLTKEQKQQLYADVPEPVASYLSERLQQTLPAISLVSQTALMSAVMNDTNSDMVFAQQVFGYGQSGDLLLAISTSGNSRNVVLAAYTAKYCGMKVISLTGADGGELASIADIAIKVPQSEVYRVQELHLPIYHALCIMIEQDLFSSDDSSQGRGDLSDETGEFTGLL